MHVKIVRAFIYESIYEQYKNKSKKTHCHITNIFLRSVLNFKIYFIGIIKKIWTVTKSYETIFFYTSKS